MATLKGPLQFDGSLGTMRSYYDSDTGKQILSSKGGLHKNFIENNPNLARVKDQNREFKALCIWSKEIRSGTQPLSYLKKGRIMGKLVSIAKRLQQMDQVSDYGYRKIESSKFNFPLAGFCMNNAHPFNIACNVDPKISITEDRREVTLELKDFVSYKNFKWTEHVWYYRVYLNIFELADVEWNEQNKRYFSIYENEKLMRSTTVSDWTHINGDAIDFQISAAFNKNYVSREKVTIVVSMGFEFASAMQFNTPYVVKGQGTMEIVGCF